MSEPIHLRVMTRSDRAFADSLRAIAGWNQTLEDWQRFLQMEPDGCFVAEWEGKPAGTATTTTYGTDLAWIGMVLVHPDMRRRGIGKALLRHCIAYLKGRGIRCIKLDATPAGKLVYDQLGFKDEWTLRRWATPMLAGKFGVGSFCTRLWDEDDTDYIDCFDTGAFGTSRWALLERLTWQGALAYLNLKPTGRINAIGLIRNGSQAAYLGPVVADCVDGAGAIIRTLLTPHADKPIFWDIPDQNLGAVDLADRLGFTPQRQLTRMFLGENHCPGDPQRVFAIAAPEVG